MNNHRDTLLAQYANSPTIVALVDAFNDWIGPEADLDGVYRDIVDIATATGNGLDIWGRIVGVSRYLAMDSASVEFGFDEQREALTLPGATPQPFDGLGTMHADATLSTTVMWLEDSAYRTLILAKAATNISSATAESINFALRLVFGRSGRCYVKETGNMAIAFVFEFSLSPLDKAILSSSNVFPRPAGVSVSILEDVSGQVLGFTQAGLQPFGSGAFYLGN